MFKINNNLMINESEIEISSIRAQGPGGQNVNKVATAIHLRFDISGSTLPDDVKQQLLATRDYRVSQKGFIVIKAQRYRTRERNVEDAFDRLRKFVLSAIQKRKKRIKSSPTVAARQRRLDQKTRRSKVKQTRKKIDSYE